MEQEVYSQPALSAQPAPQSSVSLPTTPQLPQASVKRQMNVLGSLAIIMAMLALGATGALFYYTRTEINDLKFQNDGYASQIKGLEKLADTLVEELSKNQPDPLLAARDGQRKTDLLGITNAIYQYASEHNNELPPGIQSTGIKLGTNSGLLNLAPVLVPTYISAMPKDPLDGTDADTEYFLYRNSEGKLVVQAKSEVTPPQAIEIIR